MELSRAAAAALRLVMQITLGAALFAFLFIVAVGLAYLVHYFEGQGIAPAWLIEGAKYAEIAIFAVDAGCFALYTLAEVVRFVRTVTAEMING